MTLKQGHKTENYSYHKDHGNKTENCKTLKQFLEKLVEQGHLIEYLKAAGKKSNQGKKSR